MHALLAFLLALGPNADSPWGIEGARRPQKLAPFWAGLPAAELSAPAQGVVALRVPRQGRVRIAGGRFVMGSTPQEMAEAIQLCTRETLANLCNKDNDAWSVGRAIRAEGHAHEVTVGDFDLDVTEVTVERYARCVSAGACAPPSFPLGDPRYDVPTFPVTHVTWDDANDFCRWDGGRLPTEAEWELAARGRVNNTFPWGNVYNPHLSNHGSYADDRTDGRDGFLGLAPVGSFPDGATASGLLDMAGNAAEWVADWYDRDEQQFGYPRAAQTNPKGAPFSVYGHVIRGGSYLDGAFKQRAAWRYAFPFALKDVGFRCAADPATR
ncbi:MAG: SUMF1/EgtB/PvdO family nonheme iron enzyme [Labilithrix sp.]|nr:SUMF1/EgtB/PvdO family nonheme iron enzyme [Labilithrix sp.]MCW5814656.1 SUMF1/EgtB/PvdO family nonheme iron enzyme [Labilithrix sp.]